MAHGSLPSNFQKLELGRTHRLATGGDDEEHGGADCRVKEGVEQERYVSNREREREGPSSLNYSAMTSPRKRKKPPDFHVPLFHLPGLQTINLNLECAQPSSEFTFRRVQIQELSFQFYICFVLESYNHSHTSASLLWLYRVDEMPMAPCNWITIMLNFRTLSCLSSSSPISPRSAVPLAAMGWKQLKKQKSVLPAFSKFKVLTFRSDKEGLRTSDSLEVFYPHLLCSSNH
ncbi:hypothetical protein Cgig2_027763 [Carnegiea gigantea]|uniref:Uncharacterized protein n=1 Tax=Carnegiea gigantea TaxID=171969 RepID=A0A9Q1GHS1_9CARY|nr:hypothetical protein Cgig2_027763 [Carnegiea gigantea]